MTWLVHISYYLAITSNNDEYYKYHILKRHGRSALVSIGDSKD